MPRCLYVCPRALPRGVKGDDEVTGTRQGWAYYFCEHLKKKFNNSYAETATIGGSLTMPEPMFMPKVEGQIDADGNASVYGDAGPTAVASFLCWAE